MIIRTRHWLHSTPVPCRLITGLFLLGAVLLMVASGQACSGSSLPDNALDLIPDDASEVVIRDIELILREAPSEYQDELKYIWPDEFDDIGVSLDDLTTIVEAQIDGETLIVLGGLDIEQVRNGLDDAAYDHEQYRGYDMWRVRIDFQRRWWTLIEDRGQVVSGSNEVVKSALWVHDRGSGSLLDDSENEIMRVLKKAGHGWTTGAETGCGTLGLHSCLAWSGAVKKGKEDHLISFTFSVLFENKLAVESQIDDWEEDLDELGSAVPGFGEIEEVREDGEIVLITVTMDEDTWSDGFGFFP